MPKTPRELRRFREMAVGHSIFHNPDLPRKQQSTSKRRREEADSDELVTCGRPEQEEEAEEMHIPDIIPPSDEPPVQRPTRPVSTALLDQCSVCFEEGLHSQALHLLQATLLHGTHTNAPACVPPPEHVALISTLTVHPFLTTRSRNPKEDHRDALNAAQYLRHLVKTVDIRNTGLIEAFRFNPAGKRSSRNTKPRKARTRRSRANDGDADDEDEGDDHVATLRTLYAAERSLWSNAEDFWAVVGWAFNCSLRHKHRWNTWMPWLDLMLQILSDDLDDCHARGTDLRETLLADYLSALGAGRNNKRRIMRAIMADGSAKSINEFGQIFKNEPLPPKKQSDDPIGKRQKLDLDNDEYGDYYDQSDDDPSDGKQSARTRRRTRGPAETTDSNINTPDADLPGVDALGGMESIRLRQKCMALLTRFSRLAEHLFIDTTELFDLFTEFLRPLPLAVFQQFALPAKPFFSEDYIENVHLQVAFNEMLSQPLLALAKSSSLITQITFESRFAPQAAINTSAVDNAKVSLLIESMFRALWNLKQLDGDFVRLVAQIEKGIEARLSQVSDKGKKKADKSIGEYDEAMVALQSSSERLRLLAKIVAG